MIKRVQMWVLLLMAFSIAAAACGNDVADGTSSAIRVAFVYDGAVDDGGWTQSHEIARQYVVAQLPGIETTFVENVAPGSQFQSAFDRFGSEGYDLVICTTYCQDDILMVAGNYPDTVFLSWAGLTTAANVGAFDAATEDGRYLDGLVAGSQPDVALIGYPAGFPIEEVVRGINAFTIGARELNPDVRVQAVWINSWFDPPAEQQAAQALVDAGADLLAAEVNAPAVARVAEAAGIGYVHYAADASAIAPNSWLSSFTFNWGPYYVAQVEAVADGTWEPALTYGGLKDGMIGMSSFGVKVSVETVALVRQRRDEIIDGTFDYFKGPIFDNHGNLVVAAGATIAFADRTLCCSWLIEGVIGEVPGT